MFHAIDISTSGLVAQRQRMTTIAGNIANINTTRNEEGEVSPFERRLVTFQAETERDGAEGRGVGVRYDVAIDHDTPPRKVHSPGHPDADAEGNVAYPGINLITEFVNAVEASRAYEANVAVIDITKNMAQQTLKLLA